MNRLPFSLLRIASGIKCAAPAAVLYKQSLLDQLLDRAFDRCLAEHRAMHQKYDAAQTEKHDLQFALDLKEKLELIFGGIPSKRFTRQQAEETLRKYPSITAGNWRNVETMISNSRAQAAKAAEELSQAEAELKEAAELYTLAERVYSGAHIQIMVNAEKETRSAEAVPNGTYAADNNSPGYTPLKR